MHRDGILSDLLLVMVGLTLARAQLSVALDGSIVALLHLLLSLTLFHRPAQAAMPSMVSARRSPRRPAYVQRVRSRLIPDVW